MKKYICEKLKIEEQFRRLVYPLDQRSLAQLETDILSGRRGEPLMVWEGYLLDGFSQYQIYQEHQLPFPVEDLEFRCQEAAIAWICARQLKRSDIPESLRRFLIGIQYRAEAAEVKLFRDEKNWFENGREPICHQIAVRIGQENHIAWETVRRFSHFARSLEQIRNREPKTAEDIMYGKIKIADKRLFQLSKLDERTFQRELTRLRAARPSLSENDASPKKFGCAAAETVLRASVKDMPAYDPDAEVAGLTLTIPSWSGSIERVIRETDLDIVSTNAKERLVSALRRLQKKVSETLTAIEAVE